MTNFFGIASGIGAGNPGCGAGPLYFHQHLDGRWLDIFFAEDKGDPVDRLAFLTKKISQLSYELAKKNEFFVAIGGDHSCAIGTWSGVARAKKIGLIWIDAHMDAHTPETSESGNLHGMPLAALMGYGNPCLAHPSIAPENIALIGTRSFESGEAALLKKLGVRIYFMEEVKRRGLKEIMAEAVALVSQGTDGYGVSFDLDSIDPAFVKAVGTPVPNGLDPEELLSSFSCFNDRPPLAFELVEYNPTLDPDRTTYTYATHVIEEICARSLTLAEK